MLNQGMIPAPDGFQFASQDWWGDAHLYMCEGSSIPLTTAALCAEPLQGMQVWGSVSESRVCPVCWEIWQRQQWMVACGRAGLDYLAWYRESARRDAAANAAATGAADGLVNKFINKTASDAVRPLVSVSLYRQDIRVHRRQNVIQMARLRAKRQKITHLSRPSLRRLVFSVRNFPGEFTHMLTLTYPREFPTDGRIVKKHWNHFRTMLRKHYPGVGGVWFLEFMTRGAPHLHILLNMPVNRIWLSNVWYRVVGSGDIRHLVAGTRTEQLRENYAAVAYAAKYATKADQKEVPEAFENVGRFWGVFGTKVNAERVIVASNSRQLDMEQLPSQQAGAHQVVRQVVRWCRTLYRKLCDQHEIPCRKSFDRRGRAGFTAYGTAYAFRSVIHGLKQPEFQPVRC